MIEMRRAKPGEEAPVAALWERVFGDGDDLRARFFTLCRPFGDTLTLWEDGRLRSILCIPRFTLRCPNGRALQAGYMYALATEPEARGDGFGAGIMRYGAEVLRREGADCAALVPAEPSLFRFFQRLGYVPAFSCRLWEPDAAELPEARGRCAPVGAAEYNALRRTLLAGRLFADWGDGPAAFQQFLSQSSGGALFRLDLPGGPGCAAVELDGGRVLAKELLCGPGDLPNAASLLASVFPRGRHVLRLPPWTQRGERMDWGALLWLFGHPSPWVPEGSGGYLGLSFD